MTGRRTGGAPPWPLVVPGVLALAFLSVPLVALVLAAPWGSMWTLLARESSREALRLSLVTSATATAIALVLGVPLAWLLARTRMPGLALWRALVVLPLVMPPVVGGVALLMAYGRRGTVGQWWYKWTGHGIPFTTAAVVLAETFVAMPFLVVTVEGALRGSDRRFEEAAATLGASRWSTFRRVTVPAVAPSIVAGLVLTWARALGEFGATITFAGSYPGTTQTMPLAVYAELDADRDAALALAVVLLVVSLGVLVVLRSRWWGRVLPT